MPLEELLGSFARIGVSVFQERSVGGGDILINIFDLVDWA
jgi:hypothetical protein